MLRNNANSMQTPLSRMSTPQNMLDIVTASRFIKRMGSGRTKPCLIECDADEENTVELVVKCSAGCMEKEKNLVLESISAMLGADLELPVPEPFVVLIDNDFIELIPEEEIRDIFQRGCRYAFGSRFLTSGFSVWSNGDKVPEPLANRAAEVFVFDAIIVNSDRRPDNPNCLFTGKEFAIFDHELTFTQSQILFWKEPWIEGGLDQMNGKERHIFARHYFEKKPDNLSRMVEVWGNLPVSRFEDYRNALPVEWIGDGIYIDEIIGYLKNVKSNIQVIVDHALKVFK